MVLIKFQPIEQSKEKIASFEAASDHVEITTLPSVPT